MSTSVMALCWPLKMPPTQKSVLISLADNANDQGYCWPAISTICERTCFGKTAVIEAIKWLEEAGALTADRANGRHTTYVITIDRFNQSASRTGSGDGPVRLADGTGPANGPHRSASRTTPVRQPDTNRKEPSRTVNKSNRQELDLSTWPSQPSPQELADWVAMRKKKKADVSPTVIEAMAQQLRLAVAKGWTVDECLAECVLRNWQGLKAEWLEPKGKGNGADHGNRRESLADEAERRCAAGDEREAERNGAFEFIAAGG